MNEQEKDQLITEQAAKITTLEVELAATKEVNENLQKQIEQAPAVETKAPDTFQIDGKTIGFNFHKIVHNGNAITSAEVLASEDLQKELYENESGMLKY